MKKIIYSLFFVLSACSVSNNESLNSNEDVLETSINYSSVDLYLTKPDKSTLFEFYQNSIPSFVENTFPSIIVNDSISYQSIDGFGFSLTGGSALHINNMSSFSRKSLLLDLFDKENIGISYLRVSIGASDLDAEPFSYDDIVGGSTDENLDHFSIDRDRENLIPVLKEILEIYPDIKIMGSPWSAPKWMKTNNSTIGGSLKPEYYDVYAKYLVKYIKAYQKEGITIDAITVQNEPLHDGNNPSMYMESDEQAIFVKNYLGPAFKTENINTKIIVWDHNADRPSYPISIYNDEEANQYVDGAAFHLYNGHINNLSQVHNLYPAKNLYFTEQWVGANSEFGDNLQWHVRELVIGATRNWCKTVLEWNLVSNSAYEPHTNGGCTECLGGLTIDGNSVKKNVGYYIIAHASKHVRPNSQRIYSTYFDDLPNVAFKTPEGKTVLIVLNDTSIAKAFNIKFSKESITTSLDAGAVGTYVWN